MDPGTQTESEAPRAAPPVRDRLVRGMLLLGGGEMAAKLFCFVAFTRLGRVLGPERYGSLEFVLAVVVFFTLPADCGLGAYGAREMARGRSGAPKLLLGIATLRMLLAVGSFLVLLGTILALPGSVRVLLAVYGLGFLLAPLQLQWLFQGYGKMEWVAAASVVRYGVFAALVIFCLNPETTLVWIGVFECISLVASSGLCAWVARSDLKATLAEWPPRLADLRRHLGSSWPIGLSQVSWVVLWYFATVFLGLWVADQSLGQFAAALRIVMALHTFVWMYFYNLLPTICRTAATPGRDLRQLLGPSLAFTTWAGGLGALLVTLLADDLMALAYGQAYRPAGRLLAVLIWAVPLALVSGHYRYALVACDRERLEFRGNAIGATVAIGLGMLFIPSNGAFSGAAALVVSALTVLILAYSACRQAGLVVPDVARALPAASAVAFAALTAARVSGFGIWIAACAATGVYLSLLLACEFYGPVAWRIRSVQSRPAAPHVALHGGEASLDLQGPVSA